MTWCDVIQSCVEVACAPGGLLQGASAQGAANGPAAASTPGSQGFLSQSHQQMLLARQLAQPSPLPLNRLTPLQSQQVGRRCPRPPPQCLKLAAGSSCCATGATRLARHFVSHPRVRAGSGRLLCDLALSYGCCRGAMCPAHARFAECSEKPISRPES